MSERSDETTDRSEAPAPPKKKHRTRDVVVLGVVGLLAAGGIGTLGWAASQQEVWFVNGLDVPVTVEIDGAKLVVDPQNRNTKTLAVGMHTVRVLAGERLIEESHIDVPRFTDAVVYNVLGAAPIYLETIIYKRNPAPGDNNDGPLEFLGGTRFVARDKVEYVFKEPPRQISVKGGGSVHRKQFAVAPGGWGQTVGYLSSQNQHGRASRLARSVAAAQPAHPSVKNLDSLVGIGEGADAQARLLRELRDAAPDDFETHTSYQFAMFRAGRGAEVLAEYRERHKKNPSSVIDAVLAARIELPADGRPILDDLVTRFPKDPLVVHSAARVHLVLGDPKRAEELFASVASDPSHARWIDDHARALVMLGRLDDAVSLVQGASATADSRDELGRLLVLAQLVAMPEAKRTHLRRDPSDERSKAWFRSALGEKVVAPADSEMLAKTVEIHWAALHDLSDIKHLCDAAPAYALAQVHSAIAMMLYAELERMGEIETAGRMYQLAVRSGVPRAVLSAWVLEGKDHPELARLDPELRAALDFVRARVSMEQGRKVDAELAAVKKLEALYGPVHQAIENWPAPGGRGIDSLNVVLVRQGG